MSQQAKIQASKAALSILPEDMVIGLGSGSTVNTFLQVAAKMCTFPQKVLLWHLSHRRFSC